MLHHRGRDEIAVLRARPRRRGGSASSRSRAFLSTGNEPAAALGQGAEDAEHLRLLLGDDLRHAAGIAVDVAGLERIDPQQRPVADARPPACRAAACAAMTMTMVGIGPCSASSHSVGSAISSPSRSRFVMSARTTGGSWPALWTLLPRRSTTPSIFKVLQHLLQPDPVAALDVEGLRDLPLAHLALGLGDEGDDVLAGGKGGMRLWDVWPREKLVRVHQVLSHASLAAASPAAWDL